MSEPTCRREAHRVMPPRNDRPAPKRHPGPASAATVEPRVLLTLPRRGGAAELRLSAVPDRFGKPAVELKTWFWHRGEAAWQPSGTVLVLMPTELRDVRDALDRVLG